MTKPYIDIKKFIPNVYQVLFYYAMQVNRVYNEFIIKGGRASLKSTIAAIIVILTVYLDIGNAVCLRRYQKDCRKSCRNTIIENLKRLGLDKYFTWSDKPNGLLQIKCILNNRTIEFEGLDDPDKLKSYAESGGVGVVWFEECQMVESMKKIDNVMQTFDRGDNNVIFVLCFNPKQSRKHWCNTELVAEAPNKFILHTTYLDVLEWIGEQAVKRAKMLEKRNYSQYQNEYLGLTGTYSEGKVFNNKKDISLQDILKVKEDAEYIYRGLDLGFSKKGDATAYTGWVMKTNENGGIDLYCVFEHYEKAMKLPKLVQVLKKHNKWNNKIFSDHMPVVVDTLVDKYELEVEPAYKRDLRDIGFYWLSTEVENIYICEELTPHTYNEFDSYEYLMNKDDEIDFSQYPKSNDHCIDSCRYAFSEYLKEEYAVEFSEEYEETA